MDPVSGSGRSLRCTPGVLSRQRAAQPFHLVQQFRRCGTDRHRLRLNPDPLGAGMGSPGTSSAQARFACFLPGAPSRRLVREAGLGERCFSALDVIPWRGFLPGRRLSGISGTLSGRRRFQIPPQRWFQSRLTRFGCLRPRNLDHPTPGAVGMLQSALHASDSGCTCGGRRHFFEKGIVGIRPRSVAEDRHRLAQPCRQNTPDGPVSGRQKRRSLTRGLRRPRAVRKWQAGWTQETPEWAPARPKRGQKSSPVDPGSDRG